MSYPTYRIPSDIAQRLVDAGLAPLDVEVVIARALAEDIGDGVDVTTVATVSPDHVSRLDLVARSAGTIAGVPVAAAVFAMVEEHGITFAFPVPDGAVVSAGEVVLSVTGPTHALLRAERPALNLISHLSGIATLTALWANELVGTKARVRDTRKTTPGLRVLEKYAVRCGGGVNHRMSLADAALVKDNHVVAAGGVAAAFAQVRERFPDVPVEVEVDSLDQLEEVLAAGADLVLLDNFDAEMCKEAVKRTAGRAALEASGGLTLDRARAVAESGVDYLAVGALTHSAPVLDIGADLYEVG